MAIDRSIGRDDPFHKGRRSFTDKRHGKLPSTTKQANFTFYGTYIYTHQTNQAKPLPPNTRFSSCLTRTTSTFDSGEANGILPVQLLMRQTNSLECHTGALLNNHIWRKSTPSNAMSDVFTLSRAQNKHKKWRGGRETNKEKATHKHTAFLSFPAPPF